MTELATTEARTLVFERELPHAPPKVWRALTEVKLLDEWLMKSDFQPTVGHRFRFQGDWGAVECGVLVVVPNEKLAYRWEGMGLKTIVTWTLTPTADGTRLMMEQAGFDPDHANYANFYNGAKWGWGGMLEALDRVLAGLS
ncbi:MAG: SRPBCC domain-containing protein [Cyanobacteria bacterium REEB65]|nr:SRPBCC domain-containing protein [Cyanobacteria bacterium REEB65]